MIQIPATVELRGAALGDQLNLRTRAAAILGLIGAGEHLEFRDRVVADGGVHAAIVAGIDIADSIDADLVLRGARAIRGKLVPPVYAAHGVRRSGSKLHSRNQFGQIERNAPVYVDVGNLRSGDGGALVPAI